MSRPGDRKGVVFHRWENWFFVGTIGWLEVPEIFLTAGEPFLIGNFALCRETSVIYIYRMLSLELAVKS